MRLSGKNQSTSPPKKMLFIRSGLIQLSKGFWVRLDGLKVKCMQPHSRGGRGGLKKPFANELAIVPTAIQASFTLKNTLWSGPPDNAGHEPL